MSQQSLFDNLVAEKADGEDSSDETPQRRTPSPTPGNSAKSDPNIWETQAEYMQRKRQEELLERQERNTLHKQATRQIGEEGKMYCLLWATSDGSEVDEECRRAAFGVKNRIKSLLHAKKQDTDPGDPNHIGLGDAWPYDDERPPEWHTRPAEYRRDLVSRWFRDWRHIIPTNVLDDAVEQSNMPHL